MSTAQLTRVLQLGCLIINSVCQTLQTIIHVDGCSKHKYVSVQSDEEIEFYIIVMYYEVFNDLLDKFYVFS